ncbi:efflux RND transporter permease subunit [Candidatus Gracilibacteria bacterium]|nr:efflux RND transporter permease subunit [Candidatus Gracilibacteria bacterium]
MEPLSKIWTFFLTRFRVSVLLTILIFAWGLFAYENIAKENAPDVEIPAGVIQTIFPGASPQDTEKLVTEKIEQEIKNIENLKKYTSTSLSGISIVAVEFESGTDMTKNFQDLREAVDDAEKKLPEGVPESPDIQEVKMSDIPILTLALSGDFSLSQLKNVAEFLQSEIEGISGVKEARISGVPEEKIHIFIDPKKLEKLGVSLEEIVQKIQLHHRNIPMGKVFIVGEKFDLRIKAEFKEVSELLNFPILEKDGQQVFLREISEIRREFDEMEVENFFSEGVLAQRSVSINVIKTVQRTNIFRIIEDILVTIEQQKQQNLLPKDLKISIIFDGSEDISESLNRLLSTGGQTLILIGIILFFALGWRASVLSFFAIPLTILIAIGTLFAMGDSFNFLSLFALVLAIGLLVDNAIIMTEGISDNIFEKKKTPFQAAKKAIKTFRWPIITGTFTTICAFLPMSFLISGVSGDYISTIPKTVIIVLLSSLFVSLCLLPVFAEKFFEKCNPKEIPTPQFLPKWKSWYEKKMLLILKKQKNSKQKSPKNKVGFVLFVSTVIFIFSASLFPLKQIFIEMFPTSDENYFTISLELPEGSKISETRKLMEEVEAILLPHFVSNSNGEAWIKNYSFSVGQFSPFDPQTQRNGGSSTPESNILGITINLIDKNSRKTESFKISKEIKTQLEARLPSFVEIKISEKSAGPPGGSAQIEVRLMGEDLKHLEKITGELKEKFSGMELEGGIRLKNILDTRGERLPQLSYKFDRQKLEKFGLSPTQIFQTLRASVEGVKILEIAENNEEIDVEARFDFSGQKIWTDPKSLEILSQIPIKTRIGTFIKLSDIAEYTISSELSVIRHRNGKRLITVEANIDGKATVGEFLPQIKKAISEIEKLPEEQILIGGENEDQERLAREMAQSMFLGVFLILIILVLQFNSFLQSFVIVMLLPFSLTGVFLGFWISGTPISFPAMIGIVALAGIIVNDAIVLIDRINHNTKLGKEKIEALIEAGKTRMQPILITSITTILGLLPLALSDPIWRGLGFAIIYGMTLSTILTLLLVPCLILFLESLWEKIKCVISFQ